MSALFRKSKFIFNIHLILSIIFAIPLLIVGVTGAILSFQYEIAGWVTGDAVKVQKSGEILPLEQILQRFSEQTGVKQPMRLSVPKNDGEAFKIRANKNEIYLVDPYTAQVIKKDAGEAFVRVVLAFHRYLGLTLTGNKTAGEVGKQIVAASTLAMLVLVISGIWLHFPKLKNKFIVAVKPNFKLKKYALFHNLHTSFGALSALFYVIICFTGLMWSYPWLNRAVIGLLSSEPQPKRLASEAREYKFSDIARAYEIFKAQKEGYAKFTIMLAAGDTIKFRYLDEGDANTVRAKDAAVSVKEGRILDLNLSKGITAGMIGDVKYQLHTGYILGNFGKILWSAISLLMVLFVVSGFYMTAKRAFKGKFGRQI